MTVGLLRFSILKYRWLHTVHCKLTKILQGTVEEDCEMFDLF